MIVRGMHLPAFCTPGGKLTGAPPFRLYGRAIQQAPVAAASDKMSPMMITPSHSLWRERHSPVAAIALAHASNCSPVHDEATMLQATAQRLAEFGCRVQQRADRRLQTTARFVTRRQLMEIGESHAQLIAEPSGRNTAPALTLAHARAGSPPGADPTAAGDASRPRDRRYRRLQRVVAPPCE